MLQKNFIMVLLVSTLFNKTTILSMVFVSLLIAERNIWIHMETLIGAKSMQDGHS